MTEPYRPAGCIVALWEGGPFPFLLPTIDLDIDGMNFDIGSVRVLQLSDWFVSCLGAVIPGDGREVDIVDHCDKAGLEVFVVFVFGFEAGDLGVQKLACASFPDAPFLFPWSVSTRLCIPQKLARYKNYFWSIPSRIITVVHPPSRLLPFPLVTSAAPPSVGQAGKAGGGDGVLAARLRELTGSFEIITCCDKIEKRAEMRRQCRCSHNGGRATQSANKDVEAWACVVPDDIPYRRSIVPGPHM